MANDEHVAMLKQGVAVRNVLVGANLLGAFLAWADLGGAADLRNADLSWAILIKANLSEAADPIQNDSGLPQGPAGASATS
jgi:uncharacterized protein YjbI with pentapeptide repeats